MLDRGRASSVSASWGGYLSFVFCYITMKTSHFNLMLDCDVYTLTSYYERWRKGEEEEQPPAPKQILCI